MESNANNNHRIRGPQPDEFPALAALRLTADDLEELARQGFVSEERRGRRTYHKLRFRTGGQQVVRYIGNAERAALVKADLQRLQAETKAVRELKTRMKLAKQMLTQAKRTLEPVLEAHGLAFHGLAIRRPRGRRKAAGSPSHS